MTSVKELGKTAKGTARIFSQCSAQERNNALLAIASALIEQTDAIVQANKLDIETAVQNGMSAAMQDRLTLTPERILDISQAVRHVVGLPDPVGKSDNGTLRPNGLRIYKTKVPLGVVGIIYESRPNVTVDAAALCIKSGNVCILRGGKEAIHSNTLLCKVMGDALASCGLPRTVVQLVENTDRESAREMMSLRGYLDVLIPRGGAGLIQAVVEGSTVPVIETGVGNCHIYVDVGANLNMAVNITVNAKTSRPSVCNAAETLLVHKDIAQEFLPMVEKALKDKNTELRCDDRARDILPDTTSATEEDFAAEFGDYILAVGIVDDLSQAIDHIARYTTGHSEAIVTENYSHAQRFLTEVDAAAVYVNASTRFTDGGEFGFGAEIGISTQKLHARGPMGLEELTTQKYIVYGEGQIR